MPTKAYGSPMGAPPVDTKRKQRQATPAPAAAVDPYLKHMVDAHNQFHAKAPPVQRPKTAPAPRTSVPGIDRAVDKAVTGE